MMEDRDLIELLRESLKHEDALDLLREKLGVEFKPGWMSLCLDKFADTIEAQYMKLPVDADGVPIRPGELLLHGNSGTERLVESIVIHKDGRATIRTDTGGVLMCHECRHVKPDTVESLLEEFAGRVCQSCHQWGLDSEEVISDFAERIGKAVGHGKD